MIHERNIREHVASLLRREVSLAAFEKWLAANSWNMFNDSAEAVPFVSAINLLVSELHDDVINNVQFRSELAALLKSSRVDVREQIVSMQIVISFAPVGQSAAVIAGAVRPLVLPEIQVLLPAN